MIKFPGFAVSICGLWLVAVIVAALAAPLLGLQDPSESDFLALEAPPGAAHLLGTDKLGRDILSRMIWGARTSLSVGLIAPAMAMVFGLLFGMIAGYYRGRIEAVLTTSFDVVLAIPGLVLLLLFSAIFGGSVMTVSLSLGFLFIPGFARVARATTLNFAEREFVLAARASGATDLRILIVEILPNVVIPVAAFALIAVAGAIVIEGGLSFLGLSVPAPTPSWGGGIAEGREVLETAPHVSLIPSAVMFVTVLSFNLVGDTIRSHYVDVREATL
jgi:peptide/nickel transport system permease protein